MSEQMEIPHSAIHAAMVWHQQHRGHVSSLIRTATTAYAPTGSVALHPELWTAAHWKWFEPIAGTVDDPPAYEPNFLQKFFAFFRGA